MIWAKRAAVVAAVAVVCVGEAEALGRGQPWERTP
jgi:hypothetical protein